jgi:predicted nucleic acid-binding protein
LTRIVLDASACLKWFLIDETDAEAALDLYARIHDGRVDLLEPMIWRGEIAAVIARKRPDEAVALTDDLSRIAVTVDDSAESLARAVAIAVRLDHHLFDTIYHAVALQHAITLVTADEHYYRKARTLGNITLLRDWRVPREIAEVPAKYAVPARKPSARARKKR